MKLTRVSAAGAVLALCMTVTVAQAAASSRKTYTGRGVLVYTNGLSLRIWDPINGVHQIDTGVASGGSPSLTSDGRFVAYAKNDGRGCYVIHLWDTYLQAGQVAQRARRSRPLQRRHAHLAGRQVHHLGVRRPGARRRL